MKVLVPLDMKLSNGIKFLLLPRNGNRCIFVKTQRSPDDCLSCLPAAGREVFSREEKNEKENFGFNGDIVFSNDY